MQMTEKPLIRQPPAISFITYELTHPLKIFIVQLNLSHSVLLLVVGAFGNISKRAIVSENLVITSQAVITNKDRIVFILSEMFSEVLANGFCNILDDFIFVISKDFIASIIYNIEAF